MATDERGIFISYRRDETTAYAGWLADTLDNHFGEQNVFRDIGSIAPGLDFVEAMDSALKTCAVMLVVIGRTWATKLMEHEQTGQEDYTRLEVATALQRNVRVIPVLVQGASMPRAEELPDDLAALRRRQAKELHDTNWPSDVKHLIAVLEEIVGRGEEGTRSSQSLEQRTPLLRQTYRQSGTEVAQGTIRIRREEGRRYVGEGIYQVKVLLDGAEVADLARGAALDLEVETGPHHIEIQAKNTGFNLWDVVAFKPLGFDKAEATVHVRSNEVIDLLCDASWGKWRITTQST
jgi:hypothetical protein